MISGYRRWKWIQRQEQPDECIACTSQRPLIKRATIWNLTDETSQHCGQAATFRDWRSVKKRSAPERSVR
ncbi:MAG: MEKHLA domain-containing protein [Candidatus Competibacteraceae bacterium]|nr:MEKHLA domain-containing protein [Candidatus Competibacteraceae bacterium]MCB1821458.1 MEKHLA domain-containing protein [Candidatus Competibacteraceae bacterium]